MRTYINRDQKGKFTSKKYKTVIKKYTVDPKEVAFKKFKANAIYTTIIIAILMCAFAVRDTNIARNSEIIPIVEASSVENIEFSSNSHEIPISFAIDNQVIEETEPEAIVLPVEKAPECDLSFRSLKDADYHKNIIVSPPESFKAQISTYSCDEQKILSRLSWYEGEWNENSVNAENPYATGLYHILPTTIEFCNNNGVTDYHDCALWIYNNYRSWFLSVTTHPESFNF